MFIYNKKRLFLILVLINLVLVGLYFLVFKFVLPILSFENIETKSVIAFVVVFLLMNFGLLYKMYFEKLYKLCTQVSALLAGEKYDRVVFTSKDEFGLLGLFFNQVTKNIESVSQYLKEGSRMASELSLASQIQRSVLPVSLPNVPGLDIVAKTRPAEEVGGDSFDIEVNNSEFYFYLGDVTGHGAPAGLIMMMVNTLFDIYLPTVTNTKDLAVKINATLKPRVNSSLFMTASFFRWNPASKSLFYTGAGHENIIIFRSAEGIAEVFPAGGIALAMADDVSEIVEEKQILLNSQDLMVLYSDGITEAVNATGELFGLERLRLSVNRHGHLGNSLDLFEAVSFDVKEFVGDTLQRDDMTLLVLRNVDVPFVSDRTENLVSTKWNDKV
jgi:serine phosphatase RsbU (regulator of sigma subunit)